MKTKNIGITTYCLKKENQLIKEIKKKEIKKKENKIKIIKSVNQVLLSLCIDHIHHRFA